jgi:hypothetical protein
MASIEPGIEIPPMTPMLEAAPARPDAMVASLYPDFCQRGSAVVGQDVVAFDSTDEAHSGDVLITDFPASNHNARLAQTVPAGPGAGVASGCTGGYARPLSNTSSTVLVNGEGCVRHDSVFEMNCAGPDGPGNTLGQMVYDRGTPRFGAHDSLVDFNPPFVVTDDEYGVCRAFEPLTSVPAEMSLGDHIVGGAKGFGRGVWDAVTGTVDMAAAGSQYLTDGVLGGPIDLITGGDHDYAWLPSAQRARRTEEAVADTMAAIYNDPGIVVDALTEEVVTLWEQGQYGEAIGYGSSQVIEVLIGAKGATRLRSLSKLDDASLDRLVRDGVIDADEAAEARRLRGRDGVIVHAEEVYDQAEVAPEQLWDGPTYRGDTRSPAEIEAAGGFDGLDPGGGISLDQHMNGVRPPSQWVSASTDLDIAQAYAWQPNTIPNQALITAQQGDIVGYAYHLNQAGGVNTHMVPGITNLSNLEVAFSQGIPWSSVSGYTPMIVQGPNIVPGPFMPITH